MKNLLAGTLIPGVLAVVGIVAAGALDQRGSGGPAGGPRAGSRPPQARPTASCTAKPLARQADDSSRPRLRSLPAHGRGFAASVSTASPSRAYRWPGSWPSGRPAGALVDRVGRRARRGRRARTAAFSCSITTARPRPTRCAASRWPTAASCGDSAIPVAVKRNHGMSRTVPAVTDKYVVAIGPKCDVSCLDPATGKPYWLIDLVAPVRRHGAAVVRRPVPA